MLRELKGAKILLILVTFLVAIFAVYYHSYSGDAPQSTFTKSYYDRSSDHVDPYNAEDDGSTEQNSGGIGDSTSYEYTKNIILAMLPLIEILNLEGKTSEEIEEETYVDFSALDITTGLLDEKMRAKVLLNIYRNTLRPGNIREPAKELYPSDRRKYNLEKFNNGIVALGVENFMKAATQFCEEEAAAGEIPIVSIGSGDGTVEEEIIAQYRERFGKYIRIQLVDPDPKFDGIVDFKTVDHLVAENPSIVGNCVAFIIWPNPVGNELMGNDVADSYDIEAVRKLQPKAVLVVYENSGGSGSNDFRIFLHEDSLDDIPAAEFGIQNFMSKFHFRKKESYGLDNYAVLEVARQKIILPQKGTFIPRMVKIIRKF